MAYCGAGPDWWYADAGFPCIAGDIDSGGLAYGSGMRGAFQALP